MRDGIGFESLIKERKKKKTANMNTKTNKKNKNGTDMFVNVNLSSLLNEDMDIDWKNSQGKYFSFVYMNKTGKILIKQVIDNNTVLLKYNDRERIYKTSSIKIGEIVKLVNESGKQAKVSVREKSYKVGDIISNGKS